MGRAGLGWALLESAGLDTAVCGLAVKAVARGGGVRRVILARLSELVLITIPYDGVLVRRDSLLRLQALGYTYSPSVSRSYGIGYRTYHTRTDRQNDPRQA